jgi:alkylation response protein AidB-like acyl-CoA dehydrogenase
MAWRIITQQARGEIDSNDIYQSALAHARIRHAAYLVGICRGLFAITHRYTEQRKQFGQSIATFQSIAFRLASFVTRIDAAYLLTHYAAWVADQNGESQRLACELLAVVSDLTLEWTADALQMHGSYGLTEHSEAQGYYRRAAVDALLLGTPAQLRAEAAAFLVRVDTSYNRPG